MLPSLKPEGVLPAGIHSATWEEFEARFCWNGHRARLARGLREALEALALAGCRRAYVDGSFVTAKEFPNDWDGCWDAAGVDWEALDPALLSFEDGRRAQKAKYGGEMFAAHWDATGGGQPFLDFFQQTRGGEPKGIVLIEPGSLR